MEHDMNTSPEPYSQAFYEKKAVSNNAFGFEKRENPCIRVANLIEGSVADVNISDETAFEDFDDDGNLISCKGLEHFVKCLYGKDVPVYIFDNHNHAFYFWAVNFSGRPSSLLHIDRHKDSRQPESFMNRDVIKDRSAVFTYTNTVLNVGNFVPAAVSAGIVDDVINVDSEESVTKWNDFFGKDTRTEKDDAPEKDVILDIDLDFFAPEMDYIDNEKKLKLIKKLLPFSKLVTIATSPFFIDQTKAIFWLKKVLTG